MENVQMLDLYRIVYSPKMIMRKTHRIERENENVQCNYT